MYTVFQKNVPSVACYNFDTHGSIATIFGTNVAEKVGNQNMLYFPTSPILLHYLGKQEIRKLRLFTEMLYTFSPKKHETQF